MAFSLHLCLPFAHKSTASEENVRVNAGNLTKANNYHVENQTHGSLSRNYENIMSKLWKRSRNYEKIISQLLEEISQLGQKMTTIYWIMAGEVTNKSLILSSKKSQKFHFASKIWNTNDTAFCMC